jgi:shikimate dehydrogenase
MQKLYGLIGYPLSHSFSKRYFTEKFEREGLSEQFRYELFPLPSIEALPDLLASHPELAGFNVTIPYKQAVMAYLHQSSPAAARIGAVNTVKVDNGRLYGHNTDVVGFEESLRETLARAAQQPARALVLGTGGSSRAVRWVLEYMGIEPLSVSRQPESGQLTYDALNAEVLARYPLIVNTTPLGMSPKVHECPPLPYEALNSANILFDLVYNPEETLFLRHGKSQGATVQNGLPMLYGQAEAAWRIWQS